MYKFPIKYDNNSDQTPTQTHTNMELYTDSNPETTIKVGFKNKKAAIESIEKIKNKPLDYQIKVIITLYYRAKFHPHQTPNMLSAMKVFAKWLRKYSPTSLD